VILYKEILFVVGLFFVLFLTVFGDAITTSMPGYPNASANLSESLLGKGGHHACWDWRVCMPCRGALRLRAEPATICRPCGHIWPKTHGSGTFDEQKLIDIVTMSDLAQSTASTAFGI